MNTRLSPNAAIDPRAMVEPGALVGPLCRVAAGAYLSSTVELASDVEVGPLAAIGVASPGLAASATSVLKVGSGARIGAHATVHAGLELAARCVVMPGAVVTRSVPPGAIVQGNPALIVGYVGAEQQLAATAQASASQAELTAVRGVQIHHFPLIPDLRGTLSVGEFERQIPFVPKRYFVVFDVPSREVRGEHAHRRCQELLVCLRGSCAVMVDDGERRAEIVLDTPNKGVLLPPMVWRVHYKYSADAMSLVFADTYYDPSDYIRDYDDFLRAARGEA